ncbi:chemotaxis protein MotB [Nitrosospira sp. Nsp18]|uniref:flagellar motor protein MotD n=1 Tax=Nitrosospira sp. Nsp18 TaxID=1855334 RepID=UPI0008915CB9|nr:flagellar motor protein MotD [Nitrosospira sp. Nsp18]SDA11943.1 chemotaxis protein MotB [Nitrosospira sp. Nsp18]
MPRGHRPEEHENHERWLVSYADFITLLLALFVVMYAASRLKDGQYDQVLAGSFVSAFGAQPNGSDRSVLTLDVILPKRVPKTAPIIASTLPTPDDELAVKKARRFVEAQRQQKDQMDIIAREIIAVFGSLVEDGQVRVIHSNLGLGVEINASVLFSPGQALLQQDSSRVIEAVAQVLKNDSHAIQVEGHTDNIPIVTEKFPSNWELSAVRASSVVRLMIGNGVDATRLTAAGYGENRPVGPNDTEEGRMRNRRVTIMILSSLPDASAGISSGNSSESSSDISTGASPEAIPGLSDTVSPILIDA